MIDLKSLDTIEACDSPIEIELLHPATKKGTGCFVEVLGAESSRMRDFERKVADERLKDLKAGKDKVTADDSVRRIIEIASVAIVGWYTVDTSKKKKKTVPTFLFKGEELEFSPANVQKVLTEPGLDWIGVQIYQDIKKLELFMKG